jgi:hypothetical protein
MKITLEGNDMAEISAMVEMFKTKTSPEAAVPKFTKVGIYRFPTEWLGVVQMLVDDFVTFTMKDLDVFIGEGATVAQKTGLATYIKTQLKDSIIVEQGALVGRSYLFTPYRVENGVQVLATARMIRSANTVRSGGAKTVRLRYDDRDGDVISDAMRTVR